ncbi:MAG: Flp family type IVb pilin [Actinomycetota bacterium]
MLLGLHPTLKSRLASTLNERGASAVEYGLLVALIAVVIIGAVTLLGGNLESIFDTIADAIGSAG